MRARRLRPTIRQLVGSQEAFARPYVGQAVQLSGEWMRQVLHASFLLAQAYEGKWSNEIFKV